MMIIVLTLTGCGKKTAITTSDFINITTQNNMEVSNVVSQFSQFAYIKEATVAIADSNNNNKWQLEFYVLDTVDNASGMYNNNKSGIENANSSGSTHSEVNLNNYSTYTLTNDDRYVYLSRVENTFLYVNVPKAFKEDAQKIIKIFKY